MNQNRSRPVDGPVPARLAGPERVDPLPVGQLKAPLVILPAFPEAAVKQVDEGPVPVGRGQILLEPDRLGKTGQGLVPFGLVLEDQRQVVPGFGVPGVDPDSLLQVSDRLRGLAQILQCAAQVVVPFGQVRPQPDDLAETFRSVGKLAPVPQQIAQVIPRAHQ